MRKQTKLVAVASAAALLAIGASMTSFAATGWVEEGGEWFFYDNDGAKVEDEWKKSGDKWFWLDSEESGAMATDKLVEEGEYYYYVDSTGAMVSNTWVRIVNEEQDSEDDPAEYNYYYMQATGKAYKGGDSTSFKTIDGKRYAFDSDGKMLYGWVNIGAERVSDEEAWAGEEGVYYLGNWDDGAMKTGWQKINVYDAIEDEDMDHWFNFKSNGKKEVGTTSELKVKTVNGKKYGFDERGVMVYQWTVATDDGASASDWQYFNSPEDGARVTKGWFKVIAPSEDNTFGDTTTTFAKEDAEDEAERWYYADGDGNLAVGAIKKIKGKYYGFRPDNGEKGAAMLTGLCLLEVEDGEIKTVLEADMDSDTLNDIIDETGDYASDKTTLGSDVSLYYFGSDADSDGAMKTGSATVSLDGDSYSFLFSKSGGAESKGRGLTGIDDEKYIYKYGLKMKAGTDDKYRVIKVTGATGKDTGSDGVVVEKISSSAIRKGEEPGLNIMADVPKNSDGETVKVIGTKDQTWTDAYYLVNTSGAISKKKTAAKDGDEWYFYVDSDKEIVMYTNNKNLRNTGLTEWDEWGEEKTEK